MVEQAEWIAGITLTDRERKAVAASLNRGAKRLAKARAVELAYDVPPAIQFTRRRACLLSLARVDSCIAHAGTEEAGCRRRSCLPLSGPTIASDSIEAGFVGGVDEAGAGTLEEVRSRVALCRLPDGRDGAEAGRKGGRRTRGGHKPRPASRHPVGCQGSDRLPPPQNDLGCRALQESDVRNQGNGHAAARRGRRGALCEALARRARPGRRLVRRHDQEPVECRSGFQRFLGRFGRGGERRIVAFRSRQPKPWAASSRRVPAAASRACGPPSAGSAGPVA